MTPASGSSYSVSPISLEFILVVIATLAAACRLDSGDLYFSRIERIFKPLARRRGFTVKTIGPSLDNHVSSSVNTTRALTRKKPENSPRLIAVEGNASSLSVI